jgi:hypothetical protein
MLCLQMSLKYVYLGIGAAVASYAGANFACHCWINLVASHVHVGLYAPHHIFHTYDSTKL